MSDNGKVFQIQKDGSVTEKGQIDDLLNQPASKSKSVKHTLSKNWDWLCTLGLIFLRLLICAFNEERFYRYGFGESLHVFFFDSNCWTYFIALGCVFVTWLMRRKHIKQNKWVYLVYAVGILFFTTDSDYINREVWGALAGDMWWLLVLLPPITSAIWAFALQNHQHKAVMGQ